MRLRVTNSVAVVAAHHKLPEHKRCLWRSVVNYCRREPLGTVGLVLVLVMFAAGGLADWIAPFNPEENDFSAMMEAPSWVHLLGTDQLGRDIFSRLVFGARTAMLVGFSSAVVGGVIGLVLGVTSAYFGGWFDLVFQRVLDVLMAFPLIILALAVVAVFGTGVINVIIAITVPLVPRCGRVVRASALAVREVPYVDAARALGFSHARIVRRHMMPNVLAPFLILLSAFVGQAILAEASVFAERYHCDAVAVLPTRTRAIAKSVLAAALARDPNLARAWAEHLAREVQAARLRAEILSLRTVAERLDAWVAMNARQFPSKGRWKTVAAEIATSPEALYREIAKRRSGRRS